MKTIAYLRISTGGQELNNQHLAILDYAQRNSIQIDKFLEIQMSSRKSFKARDIDGVFAKMEPVDLMLEQMLINNQIRASVFSKSWDDDWMKIEAELYPLVA